MCSYWDIAPGHVQATWSCTTYVREEGEDNVEEEYLRVGGADGMVCSNEMANTFYASNPQFSQVSQVH